MGARGVVAMVRGLVRGLSEKTGAIALAATLSVAALSFFPSEAFGMSDGEARAIADKKGLEGSRRDVFLRAIKAAPGASSGRGSPAQAWQGSEEACKRDVLDKGLLEGGLSDVAVCGHANMAKVPGEEGCVDRFEWPNLACERPVAWVSPAQAAAICESEGKRLCDAHEWEASCAGEPQPQDWVRAGSNAGRKEVWAYGPQRRGDLCAFGSQKSAGCDKAMVSGKGAMEACGTNAWPSGAHPECKSKTGVYDLHGNLAEHMNLAKSAGESTANGGSGATEMKGSWFVFPKRDKGSIHLDDCLWRAPGWHRTAVSDPRGHSNYHLGFRCCSSPKAGSGQKAAQKPSR